MAAAGAAGGVGDRVGGLVRERFKSFLAEYKHEINAGESSQAEEMLVRLGPPGGAAGATRTPPWTSPAS